MTSNQTNLFNPRYCIDSNVISSFMKNDTEEWYSHGFETQWKFIEKQLLNNIIIAPLEVRQELKSLFDSTLKLKPCVEGWLKRHQHIFKDKDDNQLLTAGLIVNKYPAYSQNDNTVTDLMIVSLAKAQRLTVITLENRATTHSKKRPKIPNVCDEFGIKCVSVSGFFRDIKSRD